MSTQNATSPETLTVPAMELLSMLHDYLGHTFEDICKNAVAYAINNDQRFEFDDGFDATHLCGVGWFREDKVSELDLSVVGWIRSNTGVRRGSGVFFVTQEQVANVVPAVVALAGEATPETENQKSDNDY